MPKILVSMDAKLLGRLDRAARRARTTRSAYLARLVARDIETAIGPGRDPEVRRALADIDRLFEENPPPPGFDVTAVLRKMRDTR